MSSVIDRLMEMSTPEPNTGCWLWLGTVSTKGYGRIVIGGRAQQAHRVAYEHLHGAIPIGLVLDHKCRVRCCVNPGHLEPVTNRENILRGEGRTAINAMATHCPNGHPYLGDNLIVKTNRDGGPYRNCRECKREGDRRRRRQRKALRRAIDHMSKPAA